jgi:hypothetical protein
MCERNATSCASGASSERVRSMFHVITTTLAVARDRVRAWFAPPASAAATTPAPAPSEQEAEEKKRVAPPFHGYPYLHSLLSAGVLNLTVLPSEMSDEMLIELARAQVIANQLPACLVLGPDRVVYVDVTGGLKPGTAALAPWALSTGVLQPPIAFDETEDLRSRREWAERFVAWIQGQFGRGYGNPSRGAVEPSPEQVEALTGFNEDGSPRGLTRCPSCGDLKGLCLDQGQFLSDGLIAVHCRCDNHNRCARCGQQLHERRLNANYYSARLGIVLHVPGICAQDHVCAPVLEAQFVARKERVQ